MLTADAEGAAVQDPPLAVPHSVVALVRLRHPLSHPHFPRAQPATAGIAGHGVGPVPQKDRHGLRRSAPGRELQQGAVFGDAVLKLIAVFSVVGLDAF